MSHKSTLFTFLMCKDDNLLMQMGGLITVLSDAQFLTPELKASVPELFNSQEASQTMGHYFSVLTSEMPFRNFTLRLYARLLLKNNQTALSDESAIFRPT